MPTNIISEIALSPIFEEFIEVDKNEFIKFSGNVFILLLSIAFHTKFDFKFNWLKLLLLLELLFEWFL